MALPGSAAAPATQSNPSALDQRLVEIDVILPGGQTYTFQGGDGGQGLAIHATGSKFGTAIMNSCECRIYNLTAQLRNQILTLASPLLSPPPNNPAASVAASGTTNQRPPVILNLRVGRISTGTFLLFTGSVISCEVTQPPDVGIVLRSLTNSYNTSVLLGIQQPAITNLSDVCSVIAQQNGLFLDFEATDKKINNYSFLCSLQTHLTRINQMGGIQANADNATLWVINAGATRKNTGFLINEATGMVGIPQVTDQGVTVRVMMNSAITIGGAVTISSVTNPAANGTFKVAKMDYEIASRDQPFWYVLLCSNTGIFQGNVG